MSMNRPVRGLGGGPPPALARGEKVRSCGHTAGGARSSGWGGNQRKQPPESGTRGGGIVGPRQKTAAAGTGVRWYRSRPPERARDFPPAGGGDGAGSHRRGPRSVVRWTWGTAWGRFRPFTKIGFAGKDGSWRSPHGDRHSRAGPRAGREKPGNGQKPPRWVFVVRVGRVSRVPQEGRCWAGWPGDTTGWKCGDRGGTAGGPRIVRAASTGNWGTVPEGRPMDVTAGTTGGGAKTGLGGGATCPARGGGGHSDRGSAGGPEGPCRPGNKTKPPGRGGRCAHPCAGRRRRRWVGGDGVVGTAVNRGQGPTTALEQAELGRNRDRQTVWPTDLWGGKSRGQRGNPRTP